MKHRPRRRFGQHFLVTPGIIERIVEVVAPQPGERLVEIGPGRGALTLPLLERAGALDVVEIDRDLAAELPSRCPPGSRLTVHCADALDFDFCALAGSGQRLRVVGNLPYNISTPLLFHLLEQRRCLADLHLMLQREVVERMAAAPGGRDYGRLTVMLAVQAHVEMLFRIPPGAFHPPPKVDSAFVRVRPDPDREPTAALADLVTQAFSMRRKTLRNALRGLLSSTDIEAVGLDPGLRPQAVPPDGYVALAQRLQLARVSRG